MKGLALLLPVLVALQVGVQPALAWAWPVDGPVLRPFVLGDDPYAGGQHRGVDIGAPAGTPVRAPAAGTVSFAGTVPTGGKTITIRTADGYAVTLQRLGSTSVSAGLAVGEGDVVGSVGAGNRAVRLPGRPQGRRAGRLRRSARAPAPVGAGSGAGRACPGRAGPRPDARPRLRLEAPQPRRSGTGGRRGAERRAGSGEQRRHGRARRGGRRKSGTRLRKVSSGHPAMREPRGCPRPRGARFRSPTRRCCARRPLPGKPSPRRPMPAHAPSGRRQDWRRCSGSGRSAPG